MLRLFTDKGKLFERMGRKAIGSKVDISTKIAEPPKEKFLLSNNV